VGYKLLAFVKRDIRTQASYRLDFVMEVASMLASIAVFFFISEVVGDTVGPHLQPYGADYFNFALFGLAFYSFFNTNSLAGAVQGYQSSGTLEVMFLTPTPILSSLLMSTLWERLFALVRALLYLLVAMFFFHARLAWTHLPSALLLLGLTVLAHTGIDLVNASFVLVTKRGSPLARFLSLITGLLGGVYYPISALPHWLRVWSYLLPTTYALDALRRTMLQGTSLLTLWPNLLALSLFTAILLPIGLLSFHYAVRRAKREGSLTQF
jgi:ABC-2 type transport system permease protein